jgi:hypothetical protein
LVLDWHTYLDYNRFEQLGNTVSTELLVFWGYIDDSGDDKTGLRTLSCVVGHYSRLFDFEAAWKRVLERKNRQLAAEGRPTISRFHATYWSTKRKEFEGWSDDEKFGFFDNLLALFYRYPVVGCGESVYKKDIAEVFPESLEQDRVDYLAHVLLFTLIVAYIDTRLMSFFGQYATDRIAFVHDSLQFNGVLTDTFEGLKHDSGITCRDRLDTIERKTWQEETLLQAADLIAYENYKVVERKQVGADMRITMKKILDTEFRGRNARYTKENLQEWRDKADKSTLTTIFKQARMTI